MGRKNLSEEKRQIILDAFETVILREGYAKASQLKIAEEAGMNQPMIHHYFSGGDELIDALLERITDRYRQALGQYIRTEDSPSLEQIIQFLCSDTFHSVSKQNEVMFSLIGQAKHHSKTVEQLSAVYHEMLEELKSYLIKANIDNPDRLAYTLMCLIIGHDWAKALGFGEHRNQLFGQVLNTLVEHSN